MVTTIKSQKRVSALVEARKKITLRIKINGTLTERIFEPVMHASNASYIYYNHTKIDYYLPKSMNTQEIDKINIQDLTKKTKKSLPTVSTEKGQVLTTIETLLSSGYSLI